jgi:transposase-like protein
VRNQVVRSRTTAAGHGRLSHGISLTGLDFHAAHRVCLRTTNGLERINRELRRRTRVASIFPNPDSCLRLISALLAKLDDEWMTGKVYLNLNP